MKMWHMYTNEFYSAAKIKQIMKFGGKLMKLGNTMVEVGQIHKDVPCSPISRSVLVSFLFLSQNTTTKAICFCPGKLIKASF